MLQDISGLGEKMNITFILRFRRRAMRVAICALPVLLCIDAHADELLIDNQVRTYTAIVPEHAQRVPLVLILHGNTQQGHDMIERTSWPQVAAREKFAALFPDGLNRAWADLRSSTDRLGRSPPAGTDDVAFLTALVQRYIDNGIADPRRIYVTGVSNGGAMTMTLACVRPQMFAAAASVIMEFARSSVAACSPKKDVPILFMNGTADPAIPFSGGHSGTGRAGAVYVSTPETISFWRRVNGCSLEDARQETLPDVDPSDHSTVTRVDSTCRIGTDVVLYRVDGGGHRMPDLRNDALMVKMVDSLLGYQNHDINGPDVIWQFMSRFSR
jgi:polyhydroxybutyrate depolymerase